MTEGRGWMPGVVRIPTDYFGYRDVAPGQMQPRAIVNHIAQGFVLTIDEWARAGTKITPHFAVERGGEVHQYVSIFDPAYHAGRLDRGVAPTWRGYRGTNPNTYTVGIEFEGFSVPPGYGYDFLYSAGAPWPDAMVEAGIRVHQWVFSEVDGLEPDELTVIGHHEIAPRSRADDPGNQWPRARIIDACLAARSRTSPPLSRRDALELTASAFDPGSDVTLNAEPTEGARRAYRLSAPR